MAEATTGKPGKPTPRAYAATVRAVPERAPRRAAAATILGLAPQGLPAAKAAEPSPAGLPTPEPPRQEPPRQEPPRQEPPSDEREEEAVDVVVDLDSGPEELDQRADAQTPSPALSPQDEAYRVPTYTPLWVQALMILVSFGLYGVYLLLKRKR